MSACLVKISIGLLAVALSVSASAEPFDLPKLGVRFDRPPSDPPITPEIETVEFATIGLFYANDTFFSIMRSNIDGSEAIPVSDPERQRQLLEAARASGVEVTKSGVTRFAGESAFYTVGTSKRDGNPNYQYSLTLMKGGRTFRFTLVSRVGDPRENEAAMKLLNSASLE